MCGLIGPVGDGGGGAGGRGTEAMVPPSPLVPYLLRQELMVGSMMVMTPPVVYPLLELVGVCVTLD